MNPADENVGIGRFSAIEAKTINVLLVGRSQSGKSTVVSTLVDPQVALTGLSFSETRDPSCHALALLHRDTKINYVLNVIDTPGLKEKRLNSSESREDDEILKLVRLFIMENVTTMNVVCFVSKIGQTHELDVDVFLKIRDFLGPEYSPNAMLLLTHCDQKEEASAEQYIMDLNNYDPTKQILEYCQLGVFQYGTLDYDEIQKWKRMPNVQEELVRSTLQRIERMRDKLIAKFIECVDEAIVVDEISAVHEIAEQTKAAAVAKEMALKEKEWRENTKQQIVDVKQAMEKEKDDMLARMEIDKRQQFEEWSKETQEMMDTAINENWSDERYDKEIKLRSQRPTTWDDKQQQWRDEWSLYNKKYFKRIQQKKHYCFLQ